MFTEYLNGVAEVVGSFNPTRSISFILVKHGISLSLILDRCPTKSLAKSLKVS